MSVLWCGGEDIDFVTGTPGVDTGATHFRSGYGRCALFRSSGAVRSNAFPGGAVTNFWVSYRVFLTVATGQVPLVMSNSANAVSAGLAVHAGGGSSNQVELVRWDGTTATQIAIETGTSFSAAVIHRLDIQVVNFGATANVNVWIDGTQVITATSVDTRGGSITTVDCVTVGGSGSGNNQVPISEIIVADEDLRAWPGLLTMALTGAGTTNNWTNNTFSNINGTSFSDTNPTSVNTTGQDQQYNVTDTPSGTFTIKACKITARMAKSASPAVTQVKLGYNSGGSVAFGTGATKALTTAYATYEQLDATNPVTGNAFTQSEINALQLDMQSLT